MRKIIRKNTRLTREILTNSFPNETLQERLKDSKVIDYKDNYSIENLGNGYIKISPKNKEESI